MSRGYGKYRRGAGSHASFHFDNLFKENTNKPSAAKSAATVGKWGITSFTSIRTINGDKPNEPAAAAAPPKPKKFFKSRNSDKGAEAAAPPSSYGKSKADDIYGGVNVASVPKRAKLSSSSGGEKSPSVSTAEKRTVTRKFFASKGGGRGGSSSPPEKKNVLSSNNSSAGGKQGKAAAAAATAAVAAAAVEKPPPIVLRICRGKSQLVNDSDESENTPTPSSTPSTSTATSPRALREAAQQQPRAENCRITRSARRSMQQDPSSSPATADTPAELSPSFTSPKQQPQPDIDLSPQYIPAEKYEMERRAMYANLLKPNSPSPKRNDVEEDVGDGGGGGGGSVVEKSDDDDDEENSVASQGGGEDGQKSETEDDIEAALNELHREEDPHVTIPPPQPLPEQQHQPEEPKRTEAAIEEDWSTDSDSNSTAPETDAAVAATVSARDAVDAKSRLAREAADDDDAAMMDDEMTGGGAAAAAAEAAAATVDPPPAVKLVISKKKGSIFKSRALITTGDEGTKKRRALYRHKWSDDKDGQGSAAAQKQAEGSAVGGDGGKAAPAGEYDEFGFNDDPLTRVKSGGSGGGGSSGGGGCGGGGEEAVDSDGGGGVTSIKCTKGDKGYYTVVKNVKKAHQIQEIGEFQEFNDDVEYILDTLQTHNPISTRCLSAITLAGKCMAPAFRMHVRAHGTVAKFFKALHDATKDQSLGLCTATVMFVLSQDRLNMDLDRDCLELMLNLLESDVSYQQALDICGLSQTQLEKNKKKVRELCAEIQSQGHAMHLNLDNITVGQLAMETLLSLTSKRAGEWFKEELRELGGLEHIMKTICECCRQVSDYVVSWTDVLLDKLRKVDRCLRVLENVTHNNEENQTYLLNYNNGIILDTLVNLYKLCDGEIPLYPVTDITDKESTGTIIREALLVTLKVLINLTHHFHKQSLGPSLIGGRAGIIETSLHLLLQVPHYIPEQKKFELGVLVLMLLINLIQDNDANKKLLMDAKAPSKLESIYSREESAVEALIAQFYHWEGCAKIAEKRTNAILDGEKDEKDEPATTAPVAHKSNEEFIEETVAKLLQKAGTHMEYTFLASYIAMLTGFLIMENKEFQTNVRQFLKGNNFVDMVELLKKFFNFMNLTASTEASSVCAIKTTEKVIKFLEECDAPPSPESADKQSYSAECMDLSYTMAH